MYQIVHTTPAWAMFRTQSLPHCTSRVLYWLGSQSMYSTRPSVMPPSLNPGFGRLRLRALWLTELDSFFPPCPVLPLALLVAIQQYPSRKKPTRFFHYYLGRLGRLPSPSCIRTRTPVLCIFHIPHTTCTRKPTGRRKSSPGSVLTPQAYRGNEGQG